MCFIWSLCWYCLIWVLFGCLYKGLLCHFYKLVRRFVMTAVCVFGKIWQGPILSINETWFVIFKHWPAVCLSLFKLQNFRILPHTHKPPHISANLWLLFVNFKVWICACYVITLIVQYIFSSIFLSMFAYFLGRESRCFLDFVIRWLVCDLSVCLLGP